jgi:plastocyanin
MGFAATPARLAAWLLLAVTLCEHPAPVAAQDVTLRTPNLSGGWVGPPGRLHTNVVHRFWQVDQGDERKLLNSPTLHLAASLPLPARALPGGLLAGVRYASNATVEDRVNEWEMHLRWALEPAPGPAAPGADGEPPAPRRFGLGLTAAWNAAASSLDGEASVTLDLLRTPDALAPARPARLRLLGVVRAFSETPHVAPEGETGPAWALGGGAVLALSRHTALAADVGRTLGSGPGDPTPRTTWGAALQLRIPATPHSLSIQASNTRTATLRGASTGGRTLWGFEFTVPIVLSRHIPALRPDRAPTTDTAAATAAARVTMTDELAFVPDTVRIRVGETVTWTNPTSIVHTVTAHPDGVRDPSAIALPPGAPPFDSGNLFPGDRFSHRFTEPGTYRYLCVPHALAPMVGVVVVEPLTSSPGPAARDPERMLHP